MSTTNLIELPAAARAGLRELVDSNAESISVAFSAPTDLASWRQAIERAQVQLAALEAAESLTIERDVAEQLVPSVIALREDLRLTVDSERRNRKLYPDADDEYFDQVSAELAGCNAFLAATAEGVS
jgi:hypothetical protein